MFQRTLYSFTGIGNWNTSSVTNMDLCLMMLLPEQDISFQSIYMSGTINVNKMENALHSYL